MEADFWFIHLKEVFKQFAKTNDRLIMTRDAVEVAEVLAVDCSENEIAVLLLIRDVTECAKVTAEHLAG
jgi:hypothetical protein